MTNPTPDPAPAALKRDLKKLRQGILRYRRGREGRDDVTYPCFPPLAVIEELFATIDADREIIAARDARIAGLEEESGDSAKWMVCCDTMRAERDTLREQIVQLEKGKRCLTVDQHTLLKERDTLRADLAEAVGLLRDADRFIGYAACHGDKCRLPHCESCCFDPEDFELVNEANRAFIAKHDGEAAK